ncbi:MAG: dienelactone hydrolase family protein, partial [Caldithrix sp.]
MNRIFLTIIALLLSFGSVTAQEHVLKRLNESPRHHEWVQIKYENRVVHAFLVFP